MESSEGSLSTRALPLALALNYWGVMSPETLLSGIFMSTTAVITHPSLPPSPLLQESKLQDLTMIDHHFLSAWSRPGPVPEAGDTQVNETIPVFKGQAHTLTSICQRKVCWGWGEEVRTCAIKKNNFYWLGERQSEMYSIKQQGYRKILECHLVCLLFINFVNTFTEFLC